MNCWQILQIEETSEFRQIKRAYATLIKQYSPEDDPVAFQRIREAFEEAKKQATYLQVDISSEKGCDSADKEQLKNRDSEHHKQSQENQLAEGIINTALSDSQTYQPELECQIEAACQNQVACQIEAASPNDTSEYATETESNQDKDDVALEQFWNTFEHLVQSAKPQIGQWNQLIRQDLLFNIEIKQTLHYNVFERLLHAIDLQKDAQHSGLNQQIIRMLSDCFGWRENELELANYFGYQGVETVLEYRNRAEEKTKAVLDGLKTEHFSSNTPLFAIVGWSFILLVLFLSILVFNNQASNINTNEVESNYKKSSNNYSHDARGSDRRRATDAEVIELCRPLLTTYSNGQDKQLLLEACKNIADKGNQEYASLYVGVAHSLSMFEGAESKQGLHWLNLSADQGNEQATFFLGVLLEESNGVLQSKDDFNQVFEQANLMGSRFASPYLQSVLVIDEAKQAHLESFRYAMKNLEPDLGNTGVVANAYSNILAMHEKSAIPRFNLDRQSIEELFLLFAPVIEQGNALEKSRFIKLLLSYTEAYQYDADLKSIASSFIGDQHDYSEVETFLWVAAYKAYDMDFGAANAILDMALIKIRQEHVFIEPNYKSYLLNTIIEQQAAYKSMETLNLPVNAIHVKQLAREVKQKLKHIAIEELTNG